MVEAQAIFTKYLTHILRDIALYQRTGLLRVEYVGGHVVEKGAIFFQNGNVVFACTERETGEKALMYITNWDKVYYSFLEGIHLANQQEKATAQYPPISYVLTPMVQKEASQTPPAAIPDVSQGSKPFTTPFNVEPVYIPSSLPKEAIHQGVHAVFRALPAAVTRQVMSQIERQDRVVFMLLDGKRTVRQIAQLVHRSELDVAHTVARLIKRGYVECVPEEEEDQRELEVAPPISLSFLDTFLRRRGRSKGTGGSTHASTVTRE